MNLRDSRVDIFKKRLDALLAHHTELKLAIYGKKKEQILHSELAIQLTLQSVVLWEAFLSDLVLAYVEMNPRKALSEIEGRVQQSVTSKFGRVCARCFRFNGPRSVNRRTLARLLDDKGWNITARTASELSSVANNFLVSRYARQFALDPGESEFFVYVVAIRNYLSHQSAGSRAALKVAIAGLSDANNAYFSGTINAIGTYLKTATPGGFTRAEIIVTRLRALADRL